MYIEFQLPRIGNDMYARHRLWEIKQEIEAWVKKHQVVGYSQKTIKYTHRLGFNNERYFSLFSMTWTPDIPFQIVKIENERY